MKKSWTVLYEKEKGKIKLACACDLLKEYLMPALCCPGYVMYIFYIHVTFTERKKYMLKKKVKVLKFVKL